ncbi:MAG: chloride channel protein [bacterium]|nr:chloride channel protein [bacterium]
MKKTRKHTHSPHILKRFALEFKRIFVLLFIKYTTRNNRFILLSMVIGLIVGLAAVSLKFLAHSIHNYAQSFERSAELHFLFPLIGLLLTTIFFKFLVHSKVGKSIADIIFCVEQRSSLVGSEKVYSHVIGGSLTVGMGGSVGLEAPVVVTGAAIGSNIAKLFKFNYKERTLLLACGASGGIAAIFNSPIAGLLFSIETLLPEFSIPTIIPLLVATASAAIVAKSLYSDQLFVFISSGWSLHAIPFYILLGISLGVFSAYFTKLVLTTKLFFEVRRHPFKKAIVGGLLLCGLIFLLPPLYGEGYEIIKALLVGDYSKLFDDYAFLAQWFQMHSTMGLVLLVSILLIIVKPIASAVTIAAGGVGGVFAPSLFVGALSGFVFSTIVNQLGFVEVPTVNFVVVGMAGALSGILHVPLTAIFLIAEITGGYSLFVPLMIVSALSFFVSKLIEPETLYTYRLSQKGLYIGHDTDKFVLHHLDLSSLISTDCTILKQEMTLGDVVDAVSKSSRNVFPVVDKLGHLVGVIVLDDLREVMFQRDLYDSVKVKSLMKDPPTVLKQSDNAEKAIRKFDAYNAWHLPVVHYNKYIGMISKKTVYEAYRAYLVESLQT